MSDYPLFPQIDERTSNLLQDDRQVIVGKGGGVAVRAFFHVRDEDFAIGHDLTAVDFAILMVHYRANDTISFNFTYQEDSVVYLCRYKGIPRYRASISCNSLIVSVGLREVSA